MSEKLEGRIHLVGIISIVIALFVIITYGTISDSNRTNKANTERCNAFCNCQEIGNCSYTFNYDDVKGCDCK